MKNWRIDANGIKFIHGDGITIDIIAPSDGFIFIYACNLSVNSFSAIPLVDVSADFESIMRVGRGHGNPNTGVGGMIMEIIKINCAKDDTVSVTMPPISYGTTYEGNMYAVSIY